MSQHGKPNMRMFVQTYLYLTIFFKKHKMFRPGLIHRCTGLKQTHHTDIRIQLLRSWLLAKAAILIDALL